MKTLPPCDHDECPPTRCLQTANAKGVGISDWLGLWKRAFIVATISAIPVTLLSDRWPWIIAVPIIGGTVWVVWVDLRGNGKRPNDEGQERRANES